MIDKFIKKVKDLKVTIIGETIVDEYKWMKVFGSSPKAKCPSGQVIDVESYQGGAAYINRIVKNFCEDVEFITGDPITKTRYVEDAFQTKYLEIKTDNNKPIRDLDKLEEQLEDRDLIIVADFGHDLIDRSVAEFLSDNYAD